MELQIQLHVHKTTENIIAYITYLNTIKYTQLVAFSPHQSIKVSLIINVDITFTGTSIYYGENTHGDVH